MLKAGTSQACDKQSEPLPGVVGQQVRFSACERKSGVAILLLLLDLFRGTELSSRQAQSAFAKAGSRASGALSFKF